jgi:hypothetical protein
MKGGMKDMAKDGSFQDFIAKERARLMKGREEALARKAEADKALQSIDRELMAIDAYQRAKGGKPLGRRRGGGRPGRRGEKRQAILEVIRQHPAGLSRGEILNLMGVKGDKSGEQSVSNALTALKKSQKVSSQSGKYLPA